jgi:hypothetical protein
MRLKIHYHVVKIKALNNAQKTDLLAGIQRKNIFIIMKINFLYLILSAQKKLGRYMPCP